MSIDNLIKILGILLTAVVFFCYAYGIRKLLQKEKKIFEVKSRIDNIESDDISRRTLSSGMVNQLQFEKITELRMKELVAELETLKMKRQFLLDKIPLMGLFKK